MAERRLLPIVLAYLPIPIAGAVLSARWGVGASPTRRPADMVLRGTALTPPLAIVGGLAAGAAMARGDGGSGRAGAGLAALVGAAFVAGSTANLPADLAAARAARSPRRLTFALAAFHLGLGLVLVAIALPPAVRTRR